MTRTSARSSHILNANIELHSPGAILMYSVPSDVNSARCASVAQFTAKKIKMFRVFALLYNNVHAISNGSMMIFTSIHDY